MLWTTKLYVIQSSLIDTTKARLEIASKKKLFPPNQILEMKNCFAHYIPSNLFIGKLKAFKFLKLPLKHTKRGNLVNIQSILYFIYFQFCYPFLLWREKKNIFSVNICCYWKKHIVNFFLIIFPFSSPSFFRLWKNVYILNSSIKKFLFDSELNNINNNLSNTCH